MAKLQRVSDATQSVYECLLRFQNALKEEDPLYGDVQTVQVLTNEHRVRAPHLHAACARCSPVARDTGIAAQRPADDR